MEIPLLGDIVIILGSSVFIILVFQRLKMPSILGFLLTGILIGPSGTSLIKAVHEVELLAEIGVIFLLFVIGIEFSLKSLLSLKRTIIGGGAIQVGGTILVTMGFALYTGMNWNQALFIGFILSLSSTAIVLKMLQSRGELSAPHGRIALAMLIFQDIIVVPMLLITPLISGESGNIMLALLILTGKVISVVVVVFLMARYAVPYILLQVVKTRSNELFILTLILICFATAFLTSTIGLSLALGAFFAGLVISESDYNHQATANILPFREIFISFFFVSIGMLLDVRFFIDHVFMILLITLAVILMKWVITNFASLVLGYPFRTVLLTGFTLFQVGEFSFILAERGLEFDLLSPEVYQYFLAVSILSMAVTPFIIPHAQWFTDHLLRLPIPGKVRRRLESFSQVRQESHQADEKALKDHIVIVGYGLNGKNLSRAAREAQIPYVIIELNPETVRTARKNGEPIIFGDASQEVILEHVHIHEARVVVIAISDPISTKKIVGQVRMFTQTAYLIVRTRYTSDIEANLMLGADQVIPEEFETSVKIFTSVLHKYLVPENEIQSFVNIIRSQNYELLRNSDYSVIKMKGMELLSRPEIEIVSLPVQQGSNAIIEKTIAETDLKNKYGVTILAIKRNMKYITHIKPDEVIHQDDILYVIGHPDKVEAFNDFLRM